MLKTKRVWACQHSLCKMMQKPTCRMVRVEVRKEVVLAASILEVESINHKICSIDPFQVL